MNQGRKNSPSCSNLIGNLGRRRLTIGFLLLGILLGAFLVANICLGSVNIPISDVALILGGNSTNEVWSTIVMQIRFPRALSAALLGGALALAGFLLQTFFQNPIAGPFVLGISSGAKLMVALSLVFLLKAGLGTSSFVLIGAAFLGALLSMSFVLVFGRKVYQSAMLIVSGVMVGYICSAITDFVITFAEDSDIVNLHNWSLGSFSGITWSNVEVMAVLIVVSLCGVMLLSKPIAACQMGDQYAASMGVNVKALRVMLILFASLLAATVTAFAGPISFVGIAVPQLARFFFKTNKPLVLIPSCFLGGAIFCLMSDLIARMVFAPIELSISSVTAIFGAPVVIWVMLRKQKGGRR